MFGFDSLCRGCVHAWSLPDSIGQPWDFNRCLEYAYENNISLQQKQLDKASSDATLLASKAMWQPTLDFSTTQGLTNYPSPADNSDHNLYAGTYGLNASWIVFNGNIRRNQIKQDELQQQIAELGIDDYRYTLQTEILAKYLNILYAKESIEIAKQNLAVSEYQKERAEALMNSGKMSRVDYSQIESQYHTDRYSLTSAESSFASAKMELKKLLELDITTDFDIVYPDFNDEEVLAPLPEKVEVFHTACTWVPALKQAIPALVASQRIQRKDSQRRLLPASVAECKRRFSQLIGRIRQLRDTVPQQFQRTGIPDTQHPSARQPQEQDGGDAGKNRKAERQTGNRKCHQHAFANH